jgi:hypothetical protein
MRIVNDYIGKELKKVACPSPGFGKFCLFVIC